MQRLYSKAPPGILLLTGWIVIAFAMAWRVRLGLDIPLMNCLFVLIGLMVYFLPGWVIKDASADALRRKLLWLLVLAAVIILVWETLRPLLATGHVK